MLLCLSVSILVTCFFVFERKAGRITLLVVAFGKVPIVASLEKKEDLATLALHSHFPSHLFRISARSSPKCDYFCPHFRQVIFPLALPLAHICFHLFLSSSQIFSPPLHQYLSDSLCFPSHRLFSPFPSLTPVLPPSVPPSFPLPLMALSPDLLQFTLSYL